MMSDGIVLGGGRTVSKMGALDLVLTNRKVRQEMDATRAKKEIAVKELNEFGVAMADCTPRGFEEFALMIREEPGLKALLYSAQANMIPLKLTSGESHVAGETIFIKYDDTPEEIIKFLGGEDTGNPQQYPETHCRS